MNIKKVFSYEYFKKLNLPLFFLGLVFFLTPFAYRYGILGDSPFAKTWTFYTCGFILTVSLFFEKIFKGSGSKGNSGNVQYVLLPWPLLLFFVFIVWMLVTAFFGLRPEISAERAIDFMAKGAVFALVYLHASKFSLSKISLWISAALSLVCFIGILQYFDIAPEFWYQRIPPAATFVNKNHAAYYVGLTLPFTLILLVWARSRKMTVLSGIFLWLALTYSLYTRTRGLWVALVCSGAYLFLLCWILHKKREDNNLRLPLMSRFKKGALVTAVVAAMVFAAIPGNIETTPIIDRFISIKDPSQINNRFRLALWRNTLEIIKDYPLTGVGANGFQFIYPAYSNKITPTPTFSPTLQMFETHNDYLQYTAETGIPGGLLFLIMVLSVPALTLYKIINTGRPGRRLYGLIFSSMGLVALFIHAFFDFPTLSAGSGNLMWPIWALWLAQICPPNGEGQAGAKKLFYPRIQIRNRFSIASSFAPVLLVGFMCLVSTGMVIGGQSLFEAVGLYNKYGSFLCDRVESNVAKANHYMPFFAMAQRFRAEFYALCHSPSAETRAVMEKFHAEDPYSTEIWFNLVPFRIETGDLEGSKDLLDRLTKIFPQNAQAIALRGYLWQQMGDDEQADFFYDTALKIDAKVYSRVAKFRAKRKTSK